LVFLLKESIVSISMGFLIMFIDWFLIRVKSSFYYPNLPIIIFTNKTPANWREN